MSGDPLFDPADFRIPEGVAHLCAGGEPPFLLRHDEAFRRYAVNKSNGPAGREAQEAEVERVRGLVARRFGIPHDSTGFVSSVAEGMSMLVESLDWQPGDNVCLDPDEYPSLAAPAMLGLPDGVEIRPVPVRDPEAVAARMDARTRLLAVSHVSYLNGARHDLAALRAATDRRGAMLVVDHTQAAGYLPLDDAAAADFAFCACYKWLLGTTGTAVAYWNRERQPGWQPRTAGWYSLASQKRPDYGARPALRPDAMRFSRGNPSYVSLYVLGSALDYLDGFGTASVRAHVQGLTTALLGRLAAAGIASTTPADPARHGASVCVETPRAAAIVRRLEAEGIYAWNGRGRIRVSFHGYNGAAEMERVAAALIRHAAAG
ncbi:aminotransferase class V-fold PLP-dependent enzyme [Roseomonas sp. KE0001]|uniref:aminotransferase class V-fold PLP-dependent enzyme n=1 Tax=Roseomonas sp. KE0001 TaxID=2479201 RepID=UPI0018DF3B12|nr:aminotransferase class V-fold PLP-dependent enzyme [Roseomonas sp. KE0001]MBI0434914.1 aminotransferase class V-fold PLP-dependent enzyme [Roseomonas sp. KE0001]